MEINTTSPTFVIISLLAAFLFTNTGVLARSQSFDPHDAPRFRHSDNDFTFQVGQVAVLVCAIENLGNKQVIWRRASASDPLTVSYLSFNEDPRYAVEHPKGSDNWNLIIREVKISDAGVYECQVSSRMRHLRKHVTLKVIDPVTPPKPKIEITGPAFIDEGERIFLKCNATSKEYPPEDIDWFRSGNALTTRPGEGLFIRKHVSLNTGTIVSSMEIKHAKLSDQGTYVCRTSNKDVTSILIHILKGDTQQTKRNTEKRVDGETGAGYNAAMGGKESGRGGHVDRTGGRGGARESMRSNLFLVLIMAFVTSLVTCLYTPIREVT